MRISGAIDFEPRRLMPPATKELGMLIQTVNRNLLGEDSMGLCYNAPLNFFGSLFALKHQSNIIDTIKDTEFACSVETLQPVSFKADLPVGKTHLRTGTVMFKHACGLQDVGLVMTGPLSGLIVSEQGNAVYAMRVFNDEPLPADPLHYHPYTPRFLELAVATLDDLDNGISTNIPATELNKRLIIDFKLRYKTYVEELRKKLGNPIDLYVSDMLFDICDELNVPIDRERFHLTRERNLV